MVKQEIESIISNPRRLLRFALESIFESSRKYPGRLHAMYYNMPTIKTIKRSTEIPIDHSQGNQQEQYLYDYASDYETSEKMLLDEAERLYNRLIEESINVSAINKIADKTEISTRSLQPPTMEEDQYTNSDAYENDLLTVKTE
jgi:hypothetical protein